MSRNPDPRDHLADALSEDILAAPAERILAEDADDGLASVAAFDRVAARAVRQSRRQRIVTRVRALAAALTDILLPQRSWRPALAAVAGLAVVAIAGDLYLHVRPDLPKLAQAPAAPPLPATKSDQELASKDAPQPAQDAVTAQPSTALRKERIADSEPPVAPPGAPAPAAATPAPPDAYRLSPPPAEAASEARRPRALAGGAAAPGSALLAAKPKRSGSDDPLRALLNDQPKQARADTEKAAKRQSSPPGAASSTLGGLQPNAAPPLFDWPLRGRLLGAFGSSGGGAANDGIDVAAPAGADIRAAEDGVVVYAGDEIKGYGDLIVLRHRDGFATVYAYVGAMRVKRDDAVRRGQVIATSGRGDTPDPRKLHFEIRKDSAPVDPAQYLPPG